jgi:CMP-N-acetylneuraminic acid synthetase
MKTPPTIAALVPMRHTSERVHGKNYRLLAGKPLFQHILDALLSCPEITQVVVDTDSATIMDILRVDYPQVCVLLRPEALRAGTIPMNEILLYDTAQVEADLYLQTHSTNPLVRPQTFSAAIHALLDNYPAYDSLFSVTRVQKRLWDGLARPLNHNPAILLRTQDLPPVYEENSCMFLFTRQTLETRRNRLGERPYMFAMQAEEAWDIDEEMDFSIVDLLLKQRQNPAKV